MKTKSTTGISRTCYQVTQTGTGLDVLIDEINNTAMPAAEKYAYQAFCCAMLAKSASGLLQKGKYIQQYGTFIGKAITIDAACYEARLLRFLVENKLENVKFTSHMEMDRDYWLANVNSGQDQYLKEVTLKALENE